MNDDELRTELRRLDPMPPDVAVESPTTPSSRARLEHIMNTPIAEQESPTSSAPAGRPRRWTRGSARTRATLGAVAAAAAVAVGGAGILSATTGSSPIAASPPLELSLGDSTAMGMCLAFDVSTLAGMSPALAATAIAVDGELVTLDVDRWYSGGDAETVVLRAASGMEALIDGFDVEVGEQYLITATDGTVNFCGYSGPATPELTAAFEQAFGG